MRVNIGALVWQPLLGRYGKRGALLLLGLPLALIIGGTGSYALFFGGTSDSVNSAINLDKGLVGWWKLDGNAKDSTPYADNGTVTAATLTTDREGKANSAYSFNGSNTFITVPDANALSPSAISVSCWVYPTAYTLGNFVSKGGNNEYRYRVNTNGTITVFDRGGTNALTTTATIPLNQWSMVSFTGDGSGLKIYINGALSKSGGTAYGPPNTTNSLWFGTFATASEFFSGTIDDVRIYNRALSSTEFAALYKEYSPGNNAASGENGLIGWWKLNGNIKDATPNARNGSINGSPTPTTDREGQTNGAYSFNGSTDFFQMPGGSVFNTAVGQAKTYSIWFKGNTPAATSYFYWEQGACLGWAFSMQTNGQIQFLLTTGDNACTGYISYSAQPTTSYGDNKWHLATAVVDRPGGNEYLYIDGSLQKTVAIDNIHGSIGGTLRIGTNWNNSLPFSGSLSDARIYNRALSATEISNLYKSYNSQISLYGASSSVNLASGLVGSWPFAGNAKDATPYSNNGTVNGATLTTDRHGSANSAYSFNGTSSYISVPDSASLDVTSGLTISAWVYPTALANNTNYNIFAKQNWSSKLGYRMALFGFNGCANLNCLTLGVGDGTNRTETVSTIDLTTLNQWYFVTATFGSGSIKYYLNGSPANTVATPVSSINNTGVGAARIGEHNSTGEFFNGSIDDIRIYNRPLSAAEVAALYNLY